MVKFFEPEVEFKVEKGSKKNIKTKITLLTILVVSISTIILVINLDIINIFKETKLKEFCLDSNSYSRVDDEELKVEKAKKVLADNLDTIKELKGFRKANIDLDVTQKNQKIPIINFVFEKTSVDKNRIPKTLCGFRTVIDIN